MQHVYGILKPFYKDGKSKEGKDVLNFFSSNGSSNAPEICQALLDADILVPKSSPSSKQFDSKISYDLVDPNLVKSRNPSMASLSALSRALSSSFSADRLSSMGSFSAILNDLNMDDAPLAEYSSTSDVRSPVEAVAASLNGKRGPDESKKHTSKSSSSKGNSKQAFEVSLCIPTTETRFDANNAAFVVYGIRFSISPLGTPLLSRNRAEPSLETERTSTSDDDDKDSSSSKLDPSGAELASSSSVSDRSSAVSSTSAFPSSLAVPLKQKQWTVWHRYSHFHELHKCLAKRFKIASTLKAVTAPVIVTPVSTLSKGSFENSKPSPTSLLVDIAPNQYYRGRHKSSSSSGDSQHSPDQPPSLPEFPGRRFTSIFGNALSAEKVEDRRIKLEQYLIQLLLQPFVWQCDELISFLDDDDHTLSMHVNHSRLLATQRMLALAAISNAKKTSAISTKLMHTWNEVGEVSRRIEKIEEILDQSGLGQARPFEDSDAHLLQRSTSVMDGAASSGSPVGGLPLTSARIQPIANAAHAYLMSFGLRSPHLSKATVVSQLPAGLSFGGANLPLASREASEPLSLSPSSDQVAELLRWFFGSPSQDAVHSESLQPSSSSSSSKSPERVSPSQAKHWLKRINAIRPLVRAHHFSNMSSAGSVVGSITSGITHERLGKEGSGPRTQGSAARGNGRPRIDSSGHSRTELSEMLGGHIVQSLPSMHEVHSLPDSDSIDDASPVDIAAVEVASFVCDKVVTPAGYLSLMSAVELPETMPLKVDAPTNVNPSPSSPTPTANSHFDQVQQALLNHVDSIISCVAPTEAAKAKRSRVVSFIQDIIQNAIGAESFPSGSFATSTYLPSGDIDMVCFINQKQELDWFIRVTEALCAVSISTDSQGQSPKMSNAKSSKPLCANPNQLVVRNVVFINAEHKLVRCIVDNLSVDISANSLNAISAVCLINAVDEWVGENHLFKRSLLLLKAWAEFESADLCGFNVKDSVGGGFSTYTLATLLIHVFNTWTVPIRHPLLALWAFFETFAEFNWGSYVVSVHESKHLWAPTSKAASEAASYISLPSQQSDGTRGPCSSLRMLPFALFAASAVSSDKLEASLEPRNANILDPAAPWNNLGRSVSRKGATALASALRIARSRLHTVLSIAQQAAAHGGLGTQEGRAFLDASLACLNALFLRTVCWYCLGDGWREDTLVHPLDGGGASERAARLAGLRPPPVPLHPPFPLAGFGYDASEINYAATYAGVVMAHHVIPSSLSALLVRILLQGAANANANATTSTTVSNSPTASSQPAPTYAVPVGELGKVLLEQSYAPELSRVLRERYGGLKKFLEEQNTLFYVRSDHPFNPNVELQPATGSLSFKEIVLRMIFREN
jgi:PX domain